MRKPKTAQVRIPSPFDATTSKTERSAVAVLMHWMRQIIERKNLDLGLPDVDTSGADRKSPDTVIYESRRSQNVLCVIEAKPPYYDVFDYDQLKKPAWEKANARRAKYFATTNFQELLWLNTQKANALSPPEEQLVDRYHLSELEDLNLIEETRYRENIVKQLERFLTRLYAVSTGKEPEPRLAIDEFLIYRLHDKVRRLSRYYAPIIEDQCHKDKAFSAKLGRWFNDQGWSFGWSPQDFDKAARQTAYLLVNKILFYYVLQAKRPDKLDPLQIPLGLTKGAQLQKILQSFFDEVLEIDYETIYTADFIDTIAFPDQKEIVKEVIDLVSILQEYDFSQLGYDIIGGIFQKLIPQDERHNLGQYFTNPDVVDLILCFCLKQEGDKVFDPSCGAGTFLVRAYQHKKLMNQYLQHQDILETLWGNDIAKFPAHLSTINLAINDLSGDRNYPNIMQEDFFNLLTNVNGFDMPERWRRVRAKTLGVNEREVEYPRWFDCIVGNPPYTRQEEIAEMAPEDRQYKEKTIDNALQDINGRRIADISRRAGIYAYFFVHGTKFLKNGGRFGFVVSESWLDVDYGKGLQEFFLNYYKIIAIIGSKVERWFEDADINTCVVILEKCSGDDRRRERDDNLVRFVYLKKPLRYFIPPAQDIWEKQVERLSSIRDRFIRTVLAHSELYESDDFRIFPKGQKELWEEGYDTEEQKYTGAKWGKYLRAPEIFFKILEKGKGKLVPLKQIAEVKFGIKTGANEFFYLTEEEIKRRGIEPEFWMHPVLSPLDKWGIAKAPLHNAGDDDKTPLTKGGTGGFDPSLTSGGTGGFDESILTERGLITTGFHLPYNPKLKQTARQLRKNMTPTEKMIWYGYFRTFKYPVLRQRPIDNYIVDFYCPEYKLVVEIDGESHFTEEGKVYDEERTTMLEQYGLKVIRFRNEDVLKNLEAVVNQIVETVNFLEKTKGGGDKSGAFDHVWKDEHGEYFKQSQFADQFELKQVLQKDGCVHWVPNYVIKSPRECRSIMVKPQDLKYRVLMIHKDKRDLKGTSVLKYIEEGEGKGYHLRPTCASRQRWYDLGSQPPPDGIWFKAFNDRVVAPQNKHRLFSSDRFYAIYAKDKAISDSLFLYLNSSLPFLMVELNGRVNLGEGALDNMTYEAAAMPVLNARKYAVSSDGIGREIVTVFSELGANSPSEVSLGKVKPDRRELDRLIMGEILGLTEEEQLEVYRAVIDLVKSRLEKAKSFGKRKKTKEGINIDLLVKIITEKIGEETLGRFYTERVLGQEVLYTKSLPEAAGDINIQQSLLGWRLYSGKQSIDCASELEARYLKVWLEAGLDQVKVPQNEGYLQVLVPELESLKRKIDEIIAPYLNSIVNAKTRDIILRQLWQGITEDVQSDQGLQAAGRL